MMKTVVIGLGNPILSDDGVGIHVVRALGEHLPPEVDIKEAAVGGMELVEMLLGYERAFIVDAIKTKNGRVGEVYRIGPSEIRPRVQSASLHNISFAEALAFWKSACPTTIPKEIIIYAVEVSDITTFSEKMSPEVERAIPKVVEMIADEIGSSL